MATRCVFLATPLHLEQQDESMRRWNVIQKARNIPSCLTLRSSLRVGHDLDLPSWPQGSDPQELAKEREASTG